MNTYERRKSQKNVSFIFPVLTPPKPETTDIQMDGVQRERDGRGQGGTFTNGTDIYTHHYTYNNNEHEDDMDEVDGNVVCGTAIKTRAKRYLGRNSVKQNNRKSADVGGMWNFFPFSIIDTESPTHYISVSRKILQRFRVGCGANFLNLPVVK